MGLTRPKAVQINTVVNQIEDPITVLNQDSTQANIDVGFVINRDLGNSPNVAIFWNESTDTFVTSFTSSSGKTNANVVITNYADLKVGKLYGNIGGGSVLTDTYVTGNLIPSANAVYNLGSLAARWKTGYFSASTLDLDGSTIAVDTNGFKFTVAGSATPIYLASNGSISISTVSASGNISALNGWVNTGSLNVTGNILSGAGTLSSLRVNGVINSTGNILSTGAIFNSLSVNGNTSLGLAGAISGSWTTIVGNITQTTSGGAVYFNTAGNILASVGRFGSVSSDGFINTSGNISAATVLAGALTSTGFINTSGNISAAVGLFGSINSTGFINSAGNVLATGGVFNNLTVNGNESVTGYLNVTGNVIASVVDAGSIESAGVIYANGTSAATSISTGAIIAAGGIAVGKDSFFNANVTIEGNLFVNGNVSVFNTNNLSISDSLIYLADDNTADTLDIGLVSSFTNPGYQHTGLVRDASDGIWKLFANVSTEPTTIVDFTNATYSSLLIGNLLASQITVTGLNSAGFINTSGNVSGAVGLFGSINSTGFINTSGNISTAQLNAGQINTAGNVLSTGGIFNTLTVNGNQSVTGYINTAGNVIAAVHSGGQVSVTGLINTAGNVLAAEVKSGTAVVNSQSFIGELFVTTRSGDEGGQLNLAPAVTNNTLNGNVVIDVFQNRLRIYESSGTNRGGYFDLAGLSSSAGTNLAAGGGASPGGESGQIQFNQSGSFAGAASLYYFTGNGSILANSGVASTSTTTGAIQVVGGVGVTGTIFAGQLNSTGNVLGTDGILSSLTVNGNITVASAYLMSSANVASSIGTSTNRWNYIYGVYGNFLSVNANYADLAENYTSDRDYLPGTVVIFGGEHEVTISTESHDPRIAGVVSTNPAYHMNVGTEGVAVALQGRVPTKVKGPVAKGDRLVSSDIQGAAERLDMSKYQPGCIIGKALENIVDDSIQTIEVVIGRV